MPDVKNCRLNQTFAIHSYRVGLKTTLKKK